MVGRGTIKDIEEEEIWKKESPGS